MRSGTTLLRKMLHSHPDLAIPREIHLTIDSFRERRRFGDLRRRADREAFAGWLVRGRGFDRLELDPGRATRALLDAPPTVGSFVGTLLRLYADRHGAPRFGDKRPLNVEAAPVLFAMFPDLQFIDLVRDPRAVVASMRTLGWIDEWYGGSFPRAVDGWMRAIRAGDAFGASVASDAYRRVRYETLLSAPEETLRSLCVFTALSEAHLERMLRYYETDDEIPAENKARFHPLVDQPLTSRAVERWRTVLNDEETAFIETVTRTEMERFGYEPLGARGYPAAWMREWRVLQARGRASRARWTWRAITPRRPVVALLTEGQRRWAERHQGAWRYGLRRRLERSDAGSP